MPANLGGVVAIAAGGSHSLALKQDGTVVAWGGNYDWTGTNYLGQATVPGGLTGVMAIAAGDTHSLALKPDGTVVAWGDTWATPPANLSGVVAIAAGNGFSFAVVVPAASLPSTRTLKPAAVTANSARLNGAIDPNASSAMAYFEYGTTAGYGSSTPTGSFRATAQDIGFVLTGLRPDTTYHYRIVASNAAGSSQGSDAQFTTLPVSTTSAQAWVAGTGGLGLRLRAAPSLSAAVLAVMPEGSVVTLLGGTGTADGMLWRQVRFGTQEGWAASQYLIFAPPGTTPMPPAAPVALQQYLSGGATPIAAGATVISDSVVLAASPGGSDSEQFTMQFEVRPSGTSFSAPTHESGMVRGGAQATAAVGGLSNRGYHWRARVLDGNGVAGPWAAFSANATDFVVNVLRLPSARFNWTPTQPFTGDSVGFSAEAAGASGLTFSWDFGGGQTASGGTASHAFAQAGDVTVTLTVTDSQGRQSQHSQTITVASRALADRINAVAAQTEGLLDDVLTGAKQAAYAADYFQEAVDATPTEIASIAALTAVSFAFGGAEAAFEAHYEEWAREALGDEAAAVIAKRFLEIEAGGDVGAELAAAAGEWMRDKGVKGSGGQSYYQMWIPRLTDFVTGKKAEIEQLRQKALAAAGSIGAAQSDALAGSLKARLLGNIALRDSYNAKVNLPVAFKGFKESNESSWTYNLGQHLFSFSFTLLGTALGGMAGAMADFASTATQAELDIFNTLAAQSGDAQMLSLSLAAVGQGTIAARRMTGNVESALNAVINSQTPTVPAGQMTDVQSFSQGTLQTDGLGLRWFAKTAYADIAVANAGPLPATYRVEAYLTKVWTTGQLPLHWVGLGEVRDDIAVAVGMDGIQLDPGAHRTVRLNFLAGDGGLLPEGQDVKYVLTARTADGYYQEDVQTLHFGTTYLDENGKVVDPTLVAGAWVCPSPVQCGVTLFPGSNVCALRISVQNPLETPLLLTLAQDLPDGTDVLDGAGGTVSTNRLSWEVDLQPGETRFLDVILLLPLPVGNPPLSNTVARVYDAINASWLQLQQAPVAVQMAAAPPPRLHAAGLGADGFGLDLWTWIPGIYRVEATSDFAAWQPLVTVTNAAGAIHVADPSAATQPARFYRALRQ